MFVGRHNVFVAQAARAPWSLALEERLANWPVDLHWPRSEDETIGLVTDRLFHLGIVDYDIPSIGGLGLMRRIRRLGMAFPCVLVADQSDAHVLQDALALEVLTVVRPDRCERTLVPLVQRLLHDRYGPTIPNDELSN